MGLRPETLEKYVELARPILIKVAKGRTFITYKELQSKMGGPGMEDIGKVLEGVSDTEYAQGRPLLSALVVHAAVGGLSGVPGDGWWELRVLPPSLRNASTEEKIDRWKKEYKHTCEYWEKHDP